MWHYTGKSREAARFLLAVTGLGDNPLVKRHSRDEGGVLDLNVETILSESPTTRDRILLDVLVWLANTSDWHLSLTTLYRLHPEDRAAVVGAIEVALLNKPETDYESAAEIAETYGVAI